VADGTRSYRVHGVSFAYSAGWLRGKPAVTSGSARLWATGCGLGPGGMDDHPRRAERAEAGTCCGFLAL